MAAGQGFKTFTTGEVLTAADTNGYLMQGVLVFADAAARTAAIASPQEGQTSYLKDTDEIQVYSGSAWVTKSGSLPSQTGNSGKYLTTDGTNASWGTVSSGGMTLLSTTTLSGSATTISSISQSYKQLQIQLIGVYASSDNASLRVQVNSDTSAKYGYSGYRSSGAGSAHNNVQDNYFDFPNITTTSSNSNLTLSGFINFLNYTSTGIKIGNSTTFAYTAASGGGAYALGLNYSGTSAISSITFTLNTGTFSGGSILIYGVN